MATLSERKIVITGATSGIGEQLAWKLAARGADLILIARSEKKLADVSAAIISTYENKVVFYCADLTDRGQLERTFLNILNNHGKIDGLVNNAGAGKFKYAVETELEETIDMFQLNVFAVIQATRMMIPSFEKQGFGHIIFIGSQAGKMATPKSSTYAATKHAVIGYANSLRMELSSKGIFVTTVNLGPVKTNFFTSADPEGSYQKRIHKYMLTPDYVAETVAKYFLKRKREINLPLWMEVGSKLYHLAPGFAEWALKSQFSKK